MKDRRGMLLTAAVLLIGLLAVSLAAGCGSSEPVARPEIKDIEPSAGAAGAQVSLVGSDFGTTQGNGVVHFGGKVADVVSWTDVLVTARVPSGLPAAVTGVTVMTADGQSNEYTFTVIASSQPDRKPAEVESNTPVQAMIAFEKKKGVDAGNWTFSVVKQSAQDANWKIDQGVPPGGGAPVYFLLKRVNKLWTVVDDGKALTQQELQGTGAPADLWVDLPPKTPAKSQQQVILEYLAQKGIVTTRASISFIKQSKTDPAWDLFMVDWPVEAQIPDAYVVLHQENGQWVVKGHGADISNTPGMPADLKP